MAAIAFVRHLFMPSAIAIAIAVGFSLKIINAAFGGAHAKMRFIELFSQNPEM